MDTSSPAIVLDPNRTFYGALWKSGRVASPSWFNTWPLLSRLASRAPSRLEIGAGLHPRLPLDGTRFADLSPTAVTALANAGANAVCADLTALPFPAGAFDLVVAFDVVEHVPDGERALDEIARVLAPRGRVVLSVPLHPEQWSAFDVAVGHHRRYAPEDLRTALERRDLRVEWSAPFGMKPKSRALTRFGLRMLERHRAFAIDCYEAAMPWLARRQAPLRFVPGLIDADDVADAVVVCGRSEGSL